MLYEIQNKRFKAKIDTLGAQLVSLKDKNGFEYIWTGEEKYWKGQAPVLFPMVGALRNGKTLINGEWYEMGQHGFARRREFSFESKSSDRISMILCSDYETREMYPFDFKLTVTYELTDSGYATIFTVKNCGKKEMPFAIGGHPGFNIPVNEKARFEDYTICFEKPEKQICPAIVEGQGLIDAGMVAFKLDNKKEIPLAHKLFYHDALVFEGLKSDKVSVVNKATGHGIEMDITGFPMFGIWSAKNDGPYVCLEPWTGCATLTEEGDEFEKKKGMAFLPAGKLAEIGFSVKILG